jgi:hypothetical protein
MGPEQLFEGLGLGLAQLREEHGRMSHGAVVLAQLRARIRLDGRCGVTIAGEPIGEQRQTHLGVRNVRERRAVPLDEHLGALASKLQDRLLAVRAIDVRQRGDGKVVVINIEGVTARICEREHSRRTAATAHRRRAERPLVVGTDETLGDKRVQVSAHDGRGVAQAAGEL